MSIQIRLQNANDHWKRQGILRHIGDYVAGDEKLFHYTGETGYIMTVPSKPARIGLWIYQLVCELENGLPFLTHFQMMASQSFRLERAPVDEAVAGWIRVVNKFPHKPALVVFNSYCFSTGSLSRLNSPVSDGDGGPVDKTKFIGAVRKDRLPLQKPWQVE